MVACVSTDLREGLILSLLNIRVQLVRTKEHTKYRYPEFDRYIESTHKPSRSIAVQTLSQHPWMSHHDTQNKRDLGERRRRSSRRRKVEEEEDEEAVEERKVTGITKSVSGSFGVWHLHKFGVFGLTWVNSTKDLVFRWPYWQGNVSIRRSNRAWSVSGSSKESDGFISGFTYPRYQGVNYCQARISEYTQVLEESCFPSRVSCLILWRTSHVLFTSHAEKSKYRLLLFYARRKKCGAWRPNCFQE